MGAVRTAGSVREVEASDHPKISGKKGQRVQITADMFMTALTARAGPNADGRTRGHVLKS